MASYAPLYDYLVVIDFEATCDEGENPVVTRANQEIIEFPWVVVDTIHGQVVDSRQIYVKPEWSKSLTPFCTQLTGITNETLANAGTLRDAVQQFDNYVYTSFIAANKSFCLITDGAWDLKYQLRGEAAAKGIKLAAHYSRFFDLRNEFVQLHKNAAHVTGLQGMLNYLGLTMEGRHHSGISDCMNISKIVARLIKDGHRFQSPETIPDNFVPEASYKDFNKSGVNSAIAAGMAAGMGNAPMSTGPEAVVKLRGLPWSATEEEISRFFAPLQPVAVHLTQNHHGRPTGEGYVEFANENDATSSLEYHKRSIGSRYVEVFKVPRSEMDRAVRPNVSGDGGAVLRMRGLPYNSTTGDISAFFGGFDIVPNGIYIVVGRDGRATGEAFVEFSSEMHAEQALKAKHREKIGTRYIELFRSSKAELTHVMNPYGGYSDQRVFDPNHNVSELVSIRMLGLPYSASENDVINFFAGLNIVPGGVHFVYNNNDRPTGEGFVEFASTEDARRALERHKMTMGSRYIELFRCTKGEMLMDLGVGGGAGLGGMGAMGGMGGMNAMGGLGGLGAMGMGGMGMGGMGGMGAMGAGMGAMGGMGGGWNQAQPQQLSEVYALLQSQMMNTMNTMGMANAYGGWPAAQTQAAPAPVAPQPSARVAPMGMGGGAGSMNVKMRGLPYHATVGDIAAFFNGYDIQRHAIALGSTPDGRPSGEAWVQFGSPDEAARAVRERNRAHMGSRYVELFLA